MTIIATLEISYFQISVFDPKLENPFNNWTSEHFHQGFSWRPGSVSFRTLEESGPIEISASRKPQSAGHCHAPIRAILVPFEVLVSGEVEIATITESQLLELQKGKYALLFQHGLSSTGRMWAHFVWEPAKELPTPVIVKADAGLSPGKVLNMEAIPASSA